MTELERHVIDCAKKLAGVAAKRRDVRDKYEWQSYAEEEMDALAELCIAVAELEDAS